MIQFDGFKKQYGQHLVLDLLQFNIPKGIYWLKGINGSGKSTLLRSLAGLIPFEGKIKMENIDIQKEKRLHRQMVNYGEAAPVFPTFFSGFDLINFYTETKNGDKQSCLQLCSKMQLGDDALKKQIGSYSSGMLKKLSLALAFVGNPQWILLDEPLITLDLAAVQTILQVVEEYHAKGVGFLLTSHQDMDFPSHALPLKILSAQNKTIIFLP